jgi:hypothetical protein
MDANTSLDKLDEDRRIKTQQKIDTIIGSYDNFMRIVMTTSDTLNRILSNDMAVFIDSLLYDSGLDVFDKKLEGLKVYQKRVNEKSRVSCNVEATTEVNKTLAEETIALNGEILDYETNKIPEVREKIKTGRAYIETLTKKLFKIDPEISGLSVSTTQETIGVHNVNISDLRAREAILKQSIAVLRETYDIERLKVLTWKKDEHKTNEYTNRMVIKGYEQSLMVIF